MSSQAEHDLTLIPGPIEFDDQVLNAMSHPTVAHTAKPFVSTFSQVLKSLRTLFFSKDPKAQAFVIAGSGTLGWDIVSSNLIEAGENALVLNTGYFSDSFADCLGVYGAKVDQLRAPIGDRPGLNEIEAALKSKNYKIITITHVDTSTGVLSDIKAISEVVHKVSPDTLVVVDGVCSVGVEEIRFDDWGLDFVLSASQKAIGAPAGLSISFASARALATVESRKTPVASYFASLLRWAPIMRAYESDKPAYFATPAVQNVYALHEALRQITSGGESAIVERFKVHQHASDRVKDTVEGLGLKLVAVRRDIAAHGMSAVYLPEGVQNTDLLPWFLKHKVVLAGGIHKEIATKYFRIGHMGVSVTNPSLGHLDKILTLLPEAIKSAKN
ncbi:alanine--glyoxylate transaminase [Sugiyamaella lignohabitans]|uniref:alanine--glyoxylate transaminase n=1 Tax=Sugiyamaella lignohabitans TaxID=796027 RepID=A0A167ENE6_9ASCO|nr:alanine--glyoxylate transaminase [Sugiyamaella lignohabitans]ANB14278.1 alanine--glyoxylate transaminase [Sugiyamaella lignohabitans]